MESEASLDNEHKFWDELQEVVSTPCSSEDHIDDALRSYLSLTTKYKDEYLHSELAVSRCSYKLLASSIFAAHGDYVRRQMVYGLLQDDDPDTLHLIVSFLLFDGRQNETAFRMMDEEGSFPRMLELLQAQNQQVDEDISARLHRLLMELLYEMSRIQRIKIQDLVLVDDEFIKSLFNIIENLSYDANDPYHYSVIRILLVLNEQFMISAHDPVGEQSSSAPLTNRVIKVLSMHGNYYKTFGENIILLINREAETSLQLLTLKLLYLIFTTPSTYEYFYTNDLHVLVDILIRNLLDLPEEASALRHTYLRVLYPLLAHTQLKSPPHYKRDELRRMLNLLVRGQLFRGELDHEKIMHFEEVDETTTRLVSRCVAVEWLQDQDVSGAEKALPDKDTESPLTTEVFPADVDIGDPLEPSRTISPTGTSTSTVASSSETASPTTVDGVSDNKPGQIQRLGMHLEPASSSSLSVQEVASQHEKPGIITPSRTGHINNTDPTKPKIKPLPPNPRRWRGRRRTLTSEDESNPINHTHTRSSTSSSYDKIPEDAVPDSAITASPIAASPTLPPVTTAAHQPGDRRNSTTTSGLAPPPIPAHSRRSASNPPPAVPPPRRSTHPAVQAHHASSHCTPVTSPSRLQTQTSAPTPTPQQSQPPSSKHGQKPQPPRTRRSGRGKTQTASDSSERLPSDTESGPVHPPHSAASSNENEKRNSGGPTISVEEAVQNVSLE